MPQTVLVTLTVAGADTGPFDLYSNVDGFAVPFETNVTKADLLAGYISYLVPDTATLIRVLCSPPCKNYIDLVIDGTTTTTTSTSSSSTTTTTSSTSSSSTTTSTTTTDVPPIPCYNVVTFDVTFAGNVVYVDCCGNAVTVFVGVGPAVINDCVTDGTLMESTAIINNISYGGGTCNCTTTTTSTTTTICPNCRSWEYDGASIPFGGDTIFYYNCLDASPTVLFLSFGAPTGQFCNCDDIGTPTSLNGTILTQLGPC